VQKCPYCDFNSHALRQELPEKSYTDALIADIKYESGLVTDRNVTSIFFGGGTPSLFSGEAVERILSAAAEYFSVCDDCEITLEANPGTAEAAHFKAYRYAGINRLSIGMQSFDNEQLLRLGRIHKAEESMLAYQLARDAGFDNINIDLMYGLPEQNLEQGLYDLQQALLLKPEHLSWYQLTIEANTRFAHEPPELPDEDAIDTLYLSGIKLLHEAGYNRYEVSAYARYGHESRHNMNYWQFGDYLGLGAGAHGKLTRNGEIKRYSRYKHPSDYMLRAGSMNVYELHNPVNEDELLLEYLLNQLRLVQGFELQHAHEAIGTDPDELISRLSAPLSRGLLEITRGNCRTTDRGMRYLNEIFLGLMPP
jgi:putative oxygen-independent coproporphyrinogen III oxidase